MKRLIILLSAVLAFVECQRRIFGGETAKQDQFGHVVLLKMDEARCTGCIIHEQWVLSAAHCVSEGADDVILPSQVTIVAGSVNLDLSKAQVRKGKEIFVHEGYTAKLGKPDLSLIRMNESFNFNGVVKKLGFNLSPWPQTNKGVWDNCVSAGWGLTEDGRTTNLKYMETSAKHGMKACPCIEKYYILKRYICLPAKASTGICFGDSGGALVCDGKIVGVAHIIIDKRSCSYTKHVDKKIKCESPHVYGIYIYTCPYLDWISEHIPGIPGTPESCAAERSAIPGARQILYIAVYIMFSYFYLAMYTF